MSVTNIVLIVSSLSLFGCAERAAPQADLSSEQIVERIHELDAAVQPAPANAMDGIARAFASVRREERVTAIIACGKSKGVSRSMKAILLTIASEDSDPLARAAALQSLYRLGRPSSALRSLSATLRSDPLLGPVTEHLSKSVRR